MSACLCCSAASVEAHLTQVRYSPTICVRKYPIGRWGGGLADSAYRTGAPPGLPGAQGETTVITHDVGSQDPSAHRASGSSAVIWRPFRRREPAGTSRMSTPREPVHPHAPSTASRSRREDIRRSGHARATLPSAPCGRIGAAVQPLKRPGRQATLPGQMLSIVRAASLETHTR